MMSLREIQALNVVFLVSASLWSIAQTNAVMLAVEVPALSDVTKAFHYQPRTPPPVFEPDYFDISSESQDVQAVDLPV